VIRLGDRQLFEAQLALVEQRAVAVVGAMTINFDRSKPIWRLEQRQDNRDRSIRSRS